MGWLEATPEKLIASAEKHKKIYNYWAARSDLEVQFDDIVNTPERSIALIANTIGIEIDNAACGRIASELKALKAPDDGEKYDPVTLLHPKHRSDRQETAMTAREIRAVLEAQKD